MLIQHQGTGSTPPDTDTAEQPDHRYGIFTFPVPERTSSSHRRRAPETENEVSS